LAGGTSEAPRKLEDKCTKWRLIISRVLELPPHKNIRLDKKSVAHPRECSFRRRWGLPRGQLADWELVLEDGRGIHVREYRDRLEVHWDKVSPAVSRLKHLLRDSPACWLLISTSIAGALGAVLGGINYILEATLIGLVAGFTALLKS